MRRYRNWSGTSGVRAFEIGPDFIVLQWNGPELYTYSYAKVGEQNVEEMKRLALKGSHLNKFINEHPEIRSGFVKSKPPVKETNEDAVNSENPPRRFGS
jgi:hypothetical protein